MTDLETIRAAAPKPESAEAVGTVAYLHPMLGSGFMHAFICKSRLPIGTKLYTAPPRPEASAPVGDSLVQTALRNLPQYISKSGLVGPDKHSAMQCFEVLRDALAQQPAAAQVRCGDERYELDAYLWRRESTQEWVLELSGTINDTSFTNRFPVPLSYAPEDAVSLPNYVEQPAAVDGADGFVNTSPMQDVLERWFMELGLDMDVAEYKKLCDDMLAALAGQQKGGRSDG